ncbi:MULTISPECIES: GNAT family N-acetyltransferase [Streptomyces]|uniref:GNAT family N-acetyltransferase n=1 Tax=Streptomyces TaxID=1883 RepID=UPI001300624A|nr:MULTISPECIES: GNAT family N-acetyltransferase [Streptomyces]
MRVREMRTDLADMEAAARVRTAGWRNTYRDLVPQSFLDGLDPERTARSWLRDGPARTHLVAEDGGAVVGWACLGAPGDADAGPGDTELYALYALPERIGTGVGGALTREVLRRANAKAADAPDAGLLVWVVAANAAGRGYYERVGFRADGRSGSFTVEGTEVTELRYRLPLPA